MSLTREDILRELELLPAWRPRMPEVAHVIPLVEKPSGTPAAKPLVDADSMPVAEVTPAEAESTPLLPDPQLNESAAIVETNIIEMISEPLIQSPWLLLCPPASDDASQALLQNILRALKLPVEDVVLHQHAISSAQVQSRFCVLFGLETANHFLGTTHADIASVRGQLLAHGDMRYVITHPPQAMLAQPALKKETWHDLCLLLAEK